MKLAIVTPQGRTLMEPVEAVTIPGSEGRFTVLRGHAPLVSAICKGVVRVDDKEMVVESGMVEVKKDVITIVTEHAQ